MTLPEPPVNPPEPCPCGCGHSWDWHETTGECSLCDCPDFDPYRTDGREDAEFERADNAWKERGL